LRERIRYAVDERAVHGEGCDGHPFLWTEPGHEPLPAEIVAPEFPEPAGLVLRGDRGDDVRWVQHHLARHGFKVVVDGVAGRKTERAIRTFQRRSGLIADAIVGSRTRAALSTVTGFPRQALPAPEPSGS
jgi:lysozyme family protein